MSSCLMSAMTNRLTSFIVARSRVRLTHQLSTAANARSTAPAGRSWLPLMSHNSSGIVAKKLEALDDPSVELAGGACGIELCETSEGVCVTAQSDKQLSCLLCRGEVRRRVLAEVREDLLGGDLILHAHRQPVLEEEVDAGSEEAALLNLLPPPVLVEVRPVLLTPGVDIGAEVLAALEDHVLDEVSGEQRRTTVVERLEDELIVVLLVQVDRDYNQLLLYHFRQPPSFSGIDDTRT